MAQGSWTSLQLYCRFTASLLAYTYDDNYTPYEYQTLLRSANAVNYLSAQVGQRRLIVATSRGPDLLLGPVDSEADS